MNIKFLKKELKKVEDLFSLSKFNQTIIKSKKILEKYPGQIPFINYMGLSYYKIGKYNIAENIFLDGLKLNPNEVSFLSNLSLIYRAVNNLTKAQEYVQSALKLNPNHYISLCNYGNLKGDLNQFDASIKLYLKAYKINSNSETLLINLATTYQYIGQFDESKKILKELNFKFPKNAYVDQLYSRIHHYKENDIHQLSMIKKVNELNDSDINKIYLYFALTKSYIDQKKYEKASQCSKIANKLKYQSLINYNFKSEENSFNLIKKIFTNYKFNNCNNINSEKLIFIVGLPRSGTTLLHQIISAHSKVFGAGELNIISNTFEKFIKDNNFLNLLSNNKLFKKDIYQEISNNILKQFKQLNDEKIILDKLPNNFKWIGFIKIFFPNSRIIHCKRNTKDTALSIYNNMFEGNAIPWAYNENNLIKFIELYKDLLIFWHNKVPNFIYDCNYEEITNDPKKIIKEILGFCNLKFEDDCINFHQRNNAIKTVSVNQARNPIHKNSINQSDYFKPYFDFLNEINS